MTILLAEVSLPYTTGLPRDVAINSLHWETAGDWTTGDLAAITTEIDHFWNDLADLDGFPQNDLNLCHFLLSPIVARGENVAKVKFYDAQAEPKVLLGETSFPLGAISPDVQPLPNEVSICLSLTSVEGAGAIPQRNRRGRMYLGPISTGTFGEMTVGGVDLPAVSTGARLAIAQRAEQMATGPSTVFWSIYSPTLDAAFAVSGGFIDNEFDTQRRRQIEATARSTWGVPFV